MSWYSPEHICKIFNVYRGVDIIICLHCNKEHSMSKGSGRRPTDQDKYNESWERIFGDKKKK